jgi:hypothetical protein
VQVTPPTGSSDARKQTAVYMLGTNKKKRYASSVREARTTGQPDGWRGRSLRNIFPEWERFTTAGTAK